jgi:hypothetical protein
MKEKKTGCQPFYRLILIMFVIDAIVILLAIHCCHAEGKELGDTGFIQKDTVDTIVQVQRAVDSIDSIIKTNSHYQLLYTIQEKDRIPYLIFVVKQRIETKEAVRILVGQMIYIAQVQEGKVVREILRRDDVEKIVLYKALNRFKAQKIRMMQFQLNYLNYH